MALYWPAMSHDFVNYDDEMYVKDNTHVTSGLTLENARWAFRTDYAGNRHPVTWLSHMLDCQMFGLKPWGHHLTSVLLHALNAGLVFVLLQQMTGATWRSLAVAALFALHPLRVESVAWVSERKDVLSGFFGLLALIAYAGYAQGRSRNPAAPNTHHVSRFTFHAPRFYLLSLCLFALGLMSKPMLVTWPFVLLLLDYWPLRRMQNAECRTQDAPPAGTHHAPPVLRSSTAEGGRNTPHVSRFTFHVSLLLEKIPFFALVALMSFVTFAAQKHGGAVEAVGKLPVSARVGNALISYGRYLGKLFWPTDLAVIYPHPGHWPLGMVVLAGGLILGLSLLVWVQRRRSPALLVGWLWFLGTLVPVIGLVQVGEQAMADRYSYLPSLGVLVLAAWGIYELTRGWRYQVMALAVAGCVASVLCFALTRQQLGYWTESEALFRHTLEVTQNNYLAHNDLGAALGKKGQLDEAILQYQASIRLKPDYADAYNNLGAAFGKKRQTDEAILQYQEAIRLNPAHALAQYNLGASLAKKGQTDEAIRYFQEAIRLKPDYADAYNNLGVAFGTKGQTDEAIRQFRDTIRVAPDHLEARNNLAIALDNKGQTEEAIAQYQEIIRRKPAYAEAHNNLGIAFYHQGRVAEAVREFQEALRLQPDYAAAQRALNTVLASKANSPPPAGAATNR